jgi:hypothetical protein
VPARRVASSLPACLAVAARAARRRLTRSLPLVAQLGCTLARDLAHPLLLFGGEHTARFFHRAVGVLAQLHQRRAVRLHALPQLLALLGRHVTDPLAPLGADRDPRVAQLLQERLVLLLQALRDLLQPRDLLIGQPQFRAVLQQKPDRRTLPGAVCRRGRFGARKRHRLLCQRRSGRGGQRRQQSQTENATHVVPPDVYPNGSETSIRS